MYPISMSILGVSLAKTKKSVTHYDAPKVAIPLNLTYEIPSEHPRLETVASAHMLAKNKRCLTDHITPDI